MAAKARHNLRTRAGKIRLGGQDLPETPGAGLPVKKSDHVAGDMPEPAPIGDVPRRVVGHRRDQFFCIERIAGRSRQQRVDTVQHRRGVVGGAANHRPVDMLQMAPRLVERLDAAIDAD